MAGVWKRDGTVAVTNGNKKVTGTGTTFADTKNGVAKGHLFCITSGTSVDFYEVDYVVSNTELYLVQAYRGVTATGKAYEIVTTFSDSVPEFARRLTATLSAYQQQSDAFQALLTSNAATIEVTAPDGTKQTLIPWKRVTSEGEGQTARAKVEADRAKTEADRALSEADRAAGIVAAAALPLPDVWAPLTDSLRLFTGYGREVKVGDDVIARMLTFSRSTTKTYTKRDGVLATAAVNEPTFDQWGLQLDGQSPNVFNKASGTNFSWISEGLTQSAGTAPLPFDVFQKTITSSTSNPTHTGRVLADIYSMPNPAASGGGPVTISAIMFGDADAIIAADPKFSISSNLSIPNPTYSIVKLTPGMVRVVWTGIITAGSAANFVNFQLSWLNRLPSVVAGCYQIEALPVVSSYVPTNGVAATRSADLLTLQNPLNIPVKAGDMTVAMEVRRNPVIPTTSFPRIFHIGGYTWLVGDGAGFAMRGGTTDQGRVLKSAPGVIETVVYRIKGNEITVRCGSLSATITRIGVLEPNLSTTFIGSDPVSAQNLFGHVRNLRVWRRALTDDQMKAIA